MSDPAGDAPENKDIWKALMRASNRKMPIIVTTQCMEGPVDMNVYAKEGSSRTSASSGMA